MRKMGRKGRTRGRAQGRELEKAFSAGAARAFATANRSAQPRTVALGDAINALTGGPGRTNGLVIDDGTRWMARDPRDEVPFGPINPLRPDALDPSRPDTKRPEPRLTEYPVAWNLPGSGEQPVPWATLRAAADSVDIMRRCISVRKEQLQGLDWSITLDEQVVQGAYAASDGSQGRTDIEAEMRRKMLPEIERLTAFWRNPWQQNGLSFEQWVNGVMEDHLVLDAVAVYPRMTYGGELSAFELIDPTTIKLLIDYRGARPAHPFPAFQQVLYGFPRAEFASCYDEQGNPVADGLMADQLWYFREEYRSFTPYGYSAVQQALISARLYLRRQGWMLAEYDDGSTPLTFLVPDATDGTLVEQLTPRSRRQWEDSLNAELSGQTRARNRMKVLMPGMTPHQMQGVDERYKPDYDMHLIKMLAGHFGVTSSGLGFSESRGLGNSGLHEGQADVQDAATTKPDKRMIERIVNELMRTYQNAPAELRFKFTDPDTEDQAAEDAAANAQRVRGTITLNDDRKRLGKSPFTFPEADMALVQLGTGWVPLEGMAARAEQQAEAEQALVDDQLATSEANRNAMDAEEVTGEAADKALELAAYRRWARKRGGDARRMFLCKSLDPADFGDAVPADVDFELWEWEVEDAEIVKSFGGNDNWRTLARDHKGRWVKRGSMRLDALGPATPDKPVLATLRADAQRSRAASAAPKPAATRSLSSASERELLGMSRRGEPGARDEVRRRREAGTLAHQDRKPDRTWEEEAQWAKPDAPAERQLPVSDASSTMGGMTSPDAPAVKRNQWGQYEWAGKRFNTQAEAEKERARDLGLAEPVPTPMRPSSDPNAIRGLVEDMGPEDEPRPVRHNGYISEGDRATNEAERRRAAEGVTDEQHAARQAQQRGRFGRKDDAVPSRAERAAKLNAGITAAMAGAAPPKGSMAERIMARQDASVRDVVASLADAPGGWVALADVRDKLAAEHGMDRGQQDAVLRRMKDAPGVRIIPAADRGKATPRDREAALTIGVSDAHLISIGGRNDSADAVPRQSGPSDDEVRTVINDLADVPGGWVSMVDVRQRMSGTRAEQDAALRRLATTGDRSLNTAPEDNQKTLTDADHAAAVDFGAGPQHVISLDPPRKSVLDTVRESSEQAAAASAVIDSVPGLREGVARQQPRAARSFDDGPLTTSADDPELTTVREATPTPGYALPTTPPAEGPRDKAERLARERAAADPMGEAARLDAVAARWDAVVAAPGDGTRDAGAHANAEHARSEAARIRAAHASTPPAARAEAIAASTPDAPSAPAAVPTARRMVIPASVTGDERARLEKFADKSAAASEANIREGVAQLERQRDETRAYLARTDLDASERKMHEGHLVRAETLLASPRGDAAVQSVKAARELAERAEREGYTVHVAHYAASDGSPFFKVEALHPETKEGFEATWHTAKGKNGSYGMSSATLRADGRQQFNSNPKKINEAMDRAAAPKVASDVRAAELDASRNVDPSMKVSRDEVQVGDWRWNEGTRGWEQIGMIADRPDAVGGRTIWGMDRETRLGAIPRDTQTIVARQAERPTMPPRAAGLKGLQRKPGEASKRGDVIVIEKTDRNYYGGNSGNTKTYETYEITSVTREGKARKVRRLTDTDGYEQDAARAFDRSLGYGTFSVVPGDRIDKEGLTADLRSHTHSNSTMPKAHDDLRELGNVLYGRMKPTESAPAPTRAPAAAPSVNDLMRQQMAASVANPSVHGAAHGKASGEQLTKGQRVQFRGTSWEVLEKPRRNRDDNAWLFRVRREDQGIESTMRLDDGKTVALAAPKGEAGASRPKAEAASAAPVTGAAALAAAPKAIDADGARRVDAKGTRALEHYRTSAFREINAKLRAGGEPDATTREIDRVMADSKLSQDVTVHRAVSDVDALFGDAARRKLDGIEWTDAAPQSTSADMDKADTFLIGSAGRRASARIVMRVPAGTGAVQLSDERYEAELLLQRGLKMRVISDTGPWRRGQKNPRTIEVEVIPA